MTFERFTKHPVITAISSIAAFLVGIGGLWALWSSEPILQWLSRVLPWKRVSVLGFGTLIGVLITTIAFAMLTYIVVVVSRRGPSTRGSVQRQITDHWAERSRLELHVIANVASGRDPTSSPIEGEPENSRLRYLKDEIEEGRLVPVSLDGRPNVNTQVGFDSLCAFAMRAGQPQWVREFATRWKEQYRKKESGQYLPDTDTALSHAILMMVLQSSWGRWHTQQSGARFLNAADQGLSIMQTAAHVVTEAAMNGSLEIRGRPVGGIAFEAIPKDTWRLATLSVVRHPASIWKVIAVPRYNVDPDRIQRLLSYDSLVVASRAFEALWPKDLAQNKRQPEQEPRKTNLRDALAAFIPEGRELQQRCREEGEQATLSDINAWVSTVSGYLRDHFGERYAVRFSDYSGLVQYSGSAKSPAERDINFRIQRLTQFLEEMA